LTTIGNSTSASTPRATQLPASWMMMLIGLALLGALAGYRKLKMTLPPDAGQAIPLAGSWFGDANDYLGMTVNVAVHKIGEAADSPEEEGA